MSAITFRHFIEHARLLGSQFAAPSWDNWKITLRAAFGERLSGNERARFRALAERDPPKRRIKELWVGVGRRAGKDSVAAAIAAYISVYGDFQSKVRLGEKITVICLAVDRTQAAIVFNYIKAFFDNIPLLKALLISANDGVVELSNGVDILVATNNFRAIRGRTVACAILDEIAFWRDEGSANPDVEVYNALMPAMITLRQSGAMLIAMSSVYRKQGLLFERFVKYHGVDDPDVLFIRAPSEVFNPTLREPAAAAEIARLIAADPERGAAEWRSEWRTDIAAFLARQALEELVDAGVREREYDVRFRGRYVAVSDESGGSGGDASTLAIGHVDGERLVQDMIRVWKPPFSSSRVIEEKAYLCRSFGIGAIHADKWAGGLPPDLYRTQGIRCETLAPKSALYRDFLHLVNSGRPLILDHSQTISEAVGLERRTHWGGGATIDHGPHGHDDCVNVLAGLCSVLASKRLPITISPEMMQLARQRPGMSMYLPPRPSGGVPPEFAPRSFVGSVSDLYEQRPAGSVAADFDRAVAATPTLGAHLRALNKRGY